MSLGNSFDIERGKGFFGLHEKKERESLLGKKVNGNFEPRGLVGVKEEGETNN